MPAHKNQTLDTSRSSSPYLEVDLEEFVHFLDGTNMNDDEKMECLQMHWRIICEIMSLGYDIHPIQQAQKACGKDAESLSEPTSKPPRMIKSEDSKIIESFGKSAAENSGEGLSK